MAFQWRRHAIVGKAVFIQSQTVRRHIAVAVRCPGQFVLGKLDPVRIPVRIGGSRIHNPPWKKQTPQQQPSSHGSTSRHHRLKNTLTSKPVVQITTGFPHHKRIRRRRSIGSLAEVIFRFDTSDQHDHGANTLPDVAFSISATQILQRSSVLTDRAILPAFSYRPGRIRIIHPTQHGKSIDGCSARFNFTPVSANHKILRETYHLPVSFYARRIRIAIVFQTEPQSAVSLPCPIDFIENGLKCIESMSNSKCCHFGFHACLSQAMIEHFNSP